MREPADGVGINAIVLDDQVAPLDQRDAHLAGKEHVLEISGIENAGREQHDVRIIDGGGCHFPELAQQALAVIGDGTHIEPLHQVGEGALHQMPVFDHVGHAGGAAAVVFEHQELTGRIADDVGPVDVDIGAVRQIETDHLRPVALVAEHKFGWNNAVLENAAVMIDIVQEQVQRLNALLHAGFDRSPGGRRQNARNDIERENAIDGVFLGIDSKSDPQIEKFPFGVGGTALQ